MSLVEAIAIHSAGFFAGAISSVDGSGSLMTSRPGSASGTHRSRPTSATPSASCSAGHGRDGYRAELLGQSRRVRRLGSASLVGGLIGGVLLLTLPSSVFDAVVPVLILVACALVIVQPRVTRVSRTAAVTPSSDGGLALYVCNVATGVYGGYFVAGQGVILLALLAIFIDESLHRLNGVKNVLAFVANSGPRSCSCSPALVLWDVAASIAISSITGGQLGAARRTPPPRSGPARGHHRRRSRRGGELIFT